MPKTSRKEKTREKPQKPEKTVQRKFNVRTYPTEHDVVRRQRERTPRARDMDAGKIAKRRAPNTGEGREKWMKRPGRYDIPGVDAPGNEREESWWGRLFRR